MRRGKGEQIDIVVRFVGVVHFLVEEMVALVCKEKRNTSRGVLVVGLL